MRLYDNESLLCTITALCTYNDIYLYTTQVNETFSSIAMRMRNFGDTLNIAIVCSSLMAMIEMATDRAGEILGYSKQELLGKYVFQLIHPDDQFRAGMP